MLSIHKAASVEYYLGKTGQSESMGMSAPSGVAYYQAALAADPLARKGEWGGRLAAELGLAPGSEVDARSFKNLAFGHHPGSRKPLHDGIPSFEEQEAADKEQRFLENKVDKLRGAFHQARELARAGGMDPHGTDFVIEARKAMEAAEKEKSGFSQTKGVRDKAHDLAFAVPKSLSCHLVALLAEAEEGKGTPGGEAKRKAAEEIERLIMASVDKTMGLIERDWPVARPREAGTRIFQQMEGLAWAKFMHFDARPVDGKTPAPQAHVHATLMNIGRLHSGEMQALWTKYLADNVQTLGAHFRSEVADGLRKLGYELVPEMQENVLSFRLSGMETSETNEFSDRAKEVEENKGKGMSDARAKTAGRSSKLDAGEFDGRDFLAENLKKMRGMGLDGASIKGSRAERVAKLTVMHGRRLEREWKEKWREHYRWEEGGKKGTEPETPKGAKPPAQGTSERNDEAWAAKVERAVEAQLKGETRGLSSQVKDILEHCLEMENFFSVRDIERRVFEMAQFVDLPEGMGLEEYRRKQVAAVITHPDLMEAQAPGGAAAGLGMDGMPLFTTRSRRAGETKLYGDLFPKLMDARDRLSFAGEKADGLIAKWEKSKGAVLAENQRATARDILTNPSGFQIVQGMAGSGKTFMAECSFRILQEAGADLIAMAPSTSAALLLRTEIGASCAHTPESLAAAMDRKGGDKLIGKNTIVFLDEASMLDYKETIGLVEKVVAAGGKIILSGDRKQLLSVGAGNVYKRVMSLATERMEREPGGPNLVSFLNEGFGDHDSIQRQASGVGRQIVAWAETGECVRALDALDRRGMVERHADPDAMLEKVAELRSEGAPKMDFVAELDRVGAAVGKAREGGEKGAEYNAALGRFYGRLDKLTEFHKERLVVAETRKQVATINAACRKRLKEAGVVGKEDVMMTLANGRKIGVAVGDRMAFTDKATKKDVEFRGGEGMATKGTTGTVVGVRMGKGGKPEIKLMLDGKPKDGNDAKRSWIWIDGTGDFAGLDHAYAMTVHRSQGQTADHVQYVGSQKSNANLFLVGISRFKQTFRLHAHVGEIEGLRHAISREQRRLDATEGGAAQYNIFDPVEVADYRDAAEEMMERAKKAHATIGGAVDPAAAEADRRLGIARAARAERDGLAARVKETVATFAERLRGREPARPAIPRDEALEAAIGSAARKAGLSVDSSLVLGIARRTGVPRDAGAGIVQRWKAEMGAAMDSAPSIKEAINGLVEYARAGLGGGDSGRAAGNGGEDGGGVAGLDHELAGYARIGLGLGKPGAELPGHPGGLGSASHLPIGGGSPSDAERGKKKVAGGSGGIASRVGGLLALRERALDGLGARAHGLLPEDQRGDLDGGNEREEAKRGDDALRRGDKAGASKGGTDGGSPGGDWEWLGVRGPDVIARNVASGQIELWDREILERNGRADVVEIALGRLGAIADAVPEPAEREWAAKGRIVEIGESRFKDDGKMAILPHAVFEGADGKLTKLWGAGLAGALAKAGLEKGDWASVANDAREIVSLPAAADAEGASAPIGATVEWAGVSAVRVVADDGMSYTIPADRCGSISGKEPGARVEIGFIETKRAVWEAVADEAPNPIDRKKREAAREAVDAALEAGILDPSLARLGQDGSGAKGLWRGMADDVVPWDHVDAGAPVWQSLGWKEDVGRRFLGTVVAMDGDTAYLACAVGDGRTGTVEAAADRIVAVPAALVGDAGIGGWVSLKAGTRGIESAGAELCAAAEAGDAPRVAELLAAGADPDMRDAKGRTAALLAAKAGASETLALLLDAGADHDAAAADGTTPIIAAAKGGHTAAAKELASRGADPKASGGGWTAIAAAKAGRHKACADALASMAGGKAREASAKGSAKGGGRAK